MWVRPRGAGVSWPTTCSHQEPSNEWYTITGNVSITSVNIQRVYIQFGGCHEMRPIRRQENDGVSCSMIWEAETEHKPQTQITLYGSNHVHKYHFTRQLSFWSSSQSWASPPPRKVIFVRNKTSDTLDLNLSNIIHLQLYLKEMKLKKSDLPLSLLVTKHSIVIRACQE